MEKKELFQTRETGWKQISNEKKEEIFHFSEEYMYFLNKVKTEREAVCFVEKMLRENGFVPVLEKEKLQPGDKVYYINHDKSMYMAVIGKEALEKGLQVLGAHVDSPRLDLKPNPLYEDSGFAYLKTHYYGGIKKYQWTTIPLAIHGVIAKTNGEKIEVTIGEEESDPIFTITDLLPHLAMEQMDKKLKEGINGENLNLLVGSIPQEDPDISEKIKLNILMLLHEKYGITEMDFVSSELEVVPSFRARTLGFDKSMIAAYGQDDRVCAYTCVRAMLDVVVPEKTAVCILSDKEEIGSVGNTGMESQVFDYFVSELLNRRGENRPNTLEQVFCHSNMLSADVDAGFDPMYASVSEKNNAAFIGHGLGLNKYTGGRGKSSASDANAEYVAEVRHMLEQANIPYQVSELGKVDVGGGGTIAYILANKGMNVIDGGVPVLSMHAPYEVTSKFDVYCAYQAYREFVK